MKHNRMKKAAGSLLGAAALSLLMALSAFAANGKISFSDPSVETGKEVNVTMKIKAEEGATLSDATVTLKYPSDKLEFVSGTDADGGAGTIRVHGASNGQGTDTLEYNLKFKTQSAGEYNLSIETQEVYDGAGQAVTIDHLGSSAIKVTAPDSVSKDASLGELEVTPGDLTPAFSADTTEYKLSVGTSISQLGINAIPADDQAHVSVSGNENFELGENKVTVTVTAADGETSKTYQITVNKEEGGPEETSAIGSGESAPETAEGVQLSSRGKTITIMNPTADVKIPEGFKSGTLSIDGQHVQGWIWEADSDPQYCVVYGMNDQGELNFYRYDLKEKTIQRYFEDPLAAGSVSKQEYQTLQTELDAQLRSAQIRFLIICILAVICFVLLAVVVYLSSRMRNMDRNERSGRGRKNSGADRFASDRQDSNADENDDEDEALLKHNFSAAPEESTTEDIMDETQVIRRPERKKHARHDAGDTMEIPRIHGMHDAAAADKTGTPEDELFGAAEGADKADETPSAKSVREGTDADTLRAEPDTETSEKETQQRDGAVPAAANAQPTDLDSDDDDGFETFDL